MKSKVSSSNKTINAFFKASSNAPLPPVDPPQKVTVAVELQADHSAADGKLGDRAVTTPISPIVTVGVAAASRPRNGPTRLPPVLTARTPNLRRLRPKTQ